MAITIDWPTKVITVPKSYMTLIQSTPIEVRELEMDTFRRDLKSIEASEEGMPFLDTHRHNTTATVGGVTLARLVEIINGYTITFEDGSYAVTLTGANNNVLDVANLNQVSIRSANSAGLVDIQAIRLQSFSLGSVWIDVNNGEAGTFYPIGTPPRPVKNFADADAILDRNKLRGFHLLGTLILGASDDVDGTEWTSPSPIIGKMSLAGSNTTGATFHNVGLVGTLNGRASFDTCSLGFQFNITGFSGIAENCGISGNITIDATNTENILFKDCVSVKNDPAPTLDCNGSTGDIHIRNWAGALTITNFSGGQAMEIDCASGNITLDSTCTAGTVILRMLAGTASITDNSGAGCTVTIESADTLTNIKPSISI
jgi:hypothetical protein